MTTIQSQSPVLSKDRFSVDAMLGHKVTRLWVINSYLVPEDDGLTLVDTGMANSARSILQAAQALGQPLRRMVLTHAHADHAGSLDELVLQVPELEFYCGEQTRAFCRVTSNCLQNTSPLLCRGGFVQSQARPVRILADGERVGSLLVVAAPGHSPDHLTYLDERDGTLYAADAFQTQGGLAVAGDLRWRFPLPAWATWNKPMALLSARKLQMLAPQRLAVGHGPVLDASTPALQQVIERAAGAFHG